MKARSTPHRVEELSSTTLSGKKFDKTDDDDDDSDKKHKKAPSSSTRRKSTLISFHCEKDAMKAAAVASFVGTDPDECAYFFEVRSQAACAGSEPVHVGLGPGGVFGVIAIIAVLVYFIGGIMYNRSVAHARGWRQLPNYTMWSSIGGFFLVRFLTSLVRLVQHLIYSRICLSLRRPLALAAYQDVVAITLCRCLRMQTPPEIATGNPMMRIVL